MPLQPALTVALVLVWQEDEDAPPVQRFRELVIAWQRAGKLWTKPAGRRWRPRSGPAQRHLGNVVPDFEPAIGRLGDLSPESGLTIGSLGNTGPESGLASR